MPTELVVFDSDGVPVDSEVIVIEIEADLLNAATRSRIVSSGSALRT
jgi:hypothetical protein